MRAMGHRKWRSYIITPVVPALQKVMHPDQDIVERIMLAIMKYIVCDVLLDSQFKHANTPTSRGRNMLAVEGRQSLA
jgi:hypothetical protein